MHPNPVPAVGRVRLHLSQLPVLRGVECGKGASAVICTTTKARKKTKNEPGIGFHSLSVVSSFFGGSWSFLLSPVSLQNTNGLRASFSSLSKSFCSFFAFRIKIKSSALAFLFLCIGVVCPLQPTPPPTAVSTGTRAPHPPFSTSMIYTQKNRGRKPPLSPIPLSKRGLLLSSPHPQLVAPNRPCSSLPCIQTSGLEWTKLSCWWFGPSPEEQGAHLGLQLFVGQAQPAVGVVFGVGLLVLVCGLGCGRWRLRDGLGIGVGVPEM